MTTRTPRPLWSFFAVLVVVAFGLNWLWAMAQMPAYAGANRRTWEEAALGCALASVGEVALTLAIYVVVAPVAGRLHRGEKGKWKVYAAVALLGLACALFNERDALTYGWWSYTDRMPVVPVLGVGLWPLLRLMLLVPLALWVAVWWTGGATNREGHSRTEPASRVGRPGWAADRVGLFRRVAHEFAERNHSRHR